MPLPGPGDEAQFGKELAAVAQRMAAVQVEGPLLQPALEDVRREAKRIEERSSHFAQDVQEAHGHLDCGAVARGTGAVFDDDLLELGVLEVGEALPPPVEARPD